MKELVIDLSKGAEHSHLEYFLDDLVAILLACLTTFRRLQSLGLRGPAVDSMDMTDSVRLSIRALASDLLRYVPLLELQELTLALPLTYDYSAIMRRAITAEDTPLRLPLHSALAYIKHLDLTIYDSHDKDPSAVRVPPSTFQAVPRSAVQLRPPNYAYAAQFFKFAQLPTRLESLRMSCTHTLDMESTNRSINHLLGVAKDVPFTIAGTNITLYLQMHIMCNVVYGVLLRHPFNTLVSTSVKMGGDITHCLTLCCPNMGRVTVVPTYNYSEGRDTIPPASTKLALATDF